MQSISHILQTKRGCILKQSFAKHKITEDGVPEHGHMGIVPFSRGAWCTDSLIPIDVE